MSAYTIGNRYLVSRALGAGGMARVFLCWDTRLRVWCAVKVMAEWVTTEPSLRHRFSIEARTLARLVHPNVMRIFDVVEAVGHPYLVAEYLPGGSLEEVARRGRVLPVQAVRLATSVCRALEVAHAAGIVHRDVKPANILLDAEGEAKLGDFGIVLLKDRLGRSSTDVVGTPAYMPIEQLEGQVDARSDLYALGATLYALLSGERPGVLRSENREQAISANVHELLRPIVRRATRPDVIDRYASAVEMAEDLQRVAHLLGPLDRNPLQFEVRAPPNRPPDRPIEGDLEALFAGTLDADEREHARTRSTPGRTPSGATGAEVEEPELERVVSRVEVTSAQSDRLLHGARELDRIRGPGVPMVLGTGALGSGGRQVTLGAARGRRLSDLAPGATDRRARSLLSVAREVCRVVARAHAHGVAHGGLDASVVWVDDGQLELVTGWGGEAGLVWLGDATEEALRADVAALGDLLGWSLGDGPVAEPLRAVVDRSRRGAYPDAVALERDLRAATAAAPRFRFVSVIGGIAAASVFVLGTATIGLLALLWQSTAPPAETVAVAAPAVPVLRPFAASGVRDRPVQRWWRSRARRVGLAKLPEYGRKWFEEHRAVSDSSVERCELDLRTFAEPSCQDGPLMKRLALGVWNGRPIPHRPQTLLESTLSRTADPTTRAAALAFSESAAARFGPVKYFSQAAGRFAARAGDWVVVANEGEAPRPVGRAAGISQVAVGSEYVAFAHEPGTVELVSLDGRDTFAIPRSIAVEALTFDDDRLVVLAEDGWVGAWAPGPPWHVSVRRPIRELAVAAPGLVVFRSDDGIAFLDRSGEVGPCDADVLRTAPGADPSWLGSEDPCSAARLRQPVPWPGATGVGEGRLDVAAVLADGTPAAGWSDGVHLRDRILATEAPVTALVALEGDLLLIGDRWGRLTAWFAEEQSPRGIFDLGAPVQAIAAEPTRLVVALTDDRVIDLEPELLALVRSESVPVDSLWIDP